MFSVIYTSDESSLPEAGMVFPELSGLLRVEGATENCFSSRVGDEDNPVLQYEDNGTGIEIFETGIQGTGAGLGIPVPEGASRTRDNRRGG